MNASILVQWNCCITRFSQSNVNSHSFVVSKLSWVSGPGQLEKKALTAAMAA